MNQHAHSTAGLTKNQLLVMDTLKNANGPLGAYTILDELRGNGFRAPLQVYRALDKLVEFGMVHRLESLNAFVACSHPACDDHGVAAFAICDTCGSVNEFADDDIEKRLNGWAKAENFKPAKTTIELRGLCAVCRQN